MNQVTGNSLSAWLFSLQARGQLSFGMDLLKKENPSLSAIAIKRALSRLTAKGSLISLHKGYYLLIPPPYASAGILPPQLYLDAFMRYLKRPYYVSLLSAAAFHGAAHQQPQEFFVTTNFPVLRPTHKKGLKINYLSLSAFPEGLLEKRKTESGYLLISNAVLTAADLVQFEKRVGGLNRVATVLFELADEIQPEDFSSQFIQQISVSTLQRLGYLLETSCKRTDLADALFAAMQLEQLSFFRIPLKMGMPIQGFGSDKRWKVIPNVVLETDF